MGSAVLPLKAVLILCDKLLKIMEKESVENGPLWVTVTVNPCHDQECDEFYCFPDLIEKLFYFIAWAILSIILAFGMFCINNICVCKNVIQNK